MVLPFFFYPRTCRQRSGQQSCSRCQTPWSKKKEMTGCATTLHLFAFSIQIKLYLAFNVTLTSHWAFWTLAAAWATLSSSSTSNAVDPLKLAFDPSSRGWPFLSRLSEESLAWKRSPVRKQKFSFSGKKTTTTKKLNEIWNDVMLTNYVIAKWCHLIGTCLQWGLKNYVKSNVPKSAVLLRDHRLNKFGPTSIFLILKASVTWYFKYIKLIELMLAEQTCSEVMWKHHDSSVHCSLNGRNCQWKQLRKLSTAAKQKLLI